MLLDVLQNIQRLFIRGFRNIFGQKFSKGQQNLQKNMQNISIYILKCFVLIDLKLGKLTHADIGQMDFYVRYYEENVKSETDNATIGIILCSAKNETVVKYSVLKDRKQLFASKYKLYLPTEEVIAYDILLNITGGSIGRCSLISPNFDETLPLPVFLAA